MKGKDRKSCIVWLLLTCVLALCFPQLAKAADLLGSLPSREILIREKDEFGKEPSHAYVFPKGTVLSAIKTSNKKVAVATADYGAERTSLQIAFGGTFQLFRRNTAMQQNANGFFKNGKK